MILLHKYSAIISKGKCLTWLQDFLLADNNSDTHNMKNGDIALGKYCSLYTQITHYKNKELKGQLSV